ncbi:DUF4376 domain-containing protein, partial [Kingella kingae]|uniref:DUF4376 domain-containing protein n=1 Tax=Kingella kingae TaxID=504 RepID=UPI00254A411F
MSIYFDYGVQTFFDDTIHSTIPDGAVLITTEQHQHLLSAINRGAKVGRDLTIYEKPSANHIWQPDTETWQINAQRQAEQHAQNQATAWDNIKQMRYHNTHSGVFVPSVGKWFHTDDASRIQYVALQTMPQMPSSLQWKTMDNHFVPMNKALLSEILGAMMLHETADFANAEQHRAAMLASDNPLDYDFSGGWQEIYSGFNSN